MNKLHKIWTTLSILTNPNLDRKSDRGAGFVEYGAILVFIALIATVVMSTGIENRIANGIMLTIDKIFSQ